MQEASPAGPPPMDWSYLKELPTYLRRRMTETLDSPRSSPRSERKKGTTFHLDGAVYTIGHYCPQYHIVDRCPAALYLYCCMTGCCYIHNPPWHVCPKYHVVAKCPAYLQQYCCFSGCCFIYYPPRHLCPEKHMVTACAAHLQQYCCSTGCCYIFNPPWHFCPKYHIVTVCPAYLDQFCCSTGCCHIYNPPFDHDPAEDAPVKISTDGRHLRQ